MFSLCLWQLHALSGEDGDDLMGKRRIKLKQTVGWFDSCFCEHSLMWLIGLMKPRTSSQCYTKPALVLHSFLAPSSFCHVISVLASPLGHLPDEEFLALFHLSPPSRTADSSHCWARRSPSAFRVGDGSLDLEMARRGGGSCILS